MPALTEVQLKAVTLIASGQTWDETAKVLKVSRSTVARWTRAADFKAELDRRRNKAVEQHTQQADALQDEEISQFYQDLKAYRQARLNIYRAKLSRAVEILKKAGRRFDDLPDESIAPASLVGLFGIADQLSEAGLNGWAEILAIDELLKRLDGNGE